MKLQNTCIQLQTDPFANTITHINTYKHISSLLTKTYKAIKPIKLLKCRIL